MFAGNMPELAVCFAATRPLHASLPHLTGTIFLSPLKSFRDPSPAQLITASKCASSSREAMSACCTLPPACSCSKKQSLPTKTQHTLVCILIYYAEQGRKEKQCYASALHGCPFLVRLRPIAFSVQCSGVARRMQLELHICVRKQPSRLARQACQESTSGPATDIAVAFQRRRPSLSWQAASRALLAPE